MSIQTISKILIHAPAHKVWQAITQPELVKQWQYGSDLITDWTAGSSIVFRNEFQGQIFEQKGIVLEVRPNTLAKYSLFFPRPDLEDKPENYFTMTYTLEEAHGQTTLTIIQDDPRPQEPHQPKEPEDDQNPILAGLKKLVEGDGTTSKNISFAVDGKPVGAYLAQPAQGGLPILVLHAWWGLSPFFIALCDRLAEAGFMAFAPDLNDGKVVNTVEDAMALMKTRDFAFTEKVAEAALQEFRKMAGKNARVGAMGFSMGAAWAIHLGLTQPENLSALALFYGTADMPMDKLSVPTLAHFAETDEWENLPEAQRMAQDAHAASHDFTLHIYPGTGHWFFEDNRPENFHPQAAALAWERTVAFLVKHLKTH